MRFSDILGHEKPLKIINGYIEKSCFFGGFIFSGPEGVGKKTVAKIIAQKINCMSLEGKPCGSCSSCLRIENLQHPDVHIIENDASQIKIDDIRSLQREASFRPYEALMKVFIIDNAHRLNPDAANSLLKVLEEPPRGSLIILITHKPQNIFKTVLSRCKVIKFFPLVRTELEAVLIKNYFVDKITAHFIAFYAEGRLGLAMKLKDSKIFEEKNKIFDSFLLYNKPHDPNLTSQSKEELHVSLNILASLFRDMYLLKAGMADREAIHLDRQSDLLKLIPKFSFRQLDDIMATISESFLYLENNINSKLLVHNLGAQLWKA